MSSRTHGTVIRKNKQKADAVQLYNDIGFEVVTDKVFDHKCWYNESDERIKEKLDNNEIYRCIEVLNLDRPYFRVSHYYLKQSSKVNCPVSKQIEAENIRQKIKRNKELMVEKSTETMRKWADDMADYTSKSDGMTLNEQTILDVLVLKNCGYQFLNSIGLKTGQMDMVKYVTDNAKDRNRWYREFIRTKLSEASVMYDSKLKELQNMLFSEQYPEKYNEMTSKLKVHTPRRKRR